MGDDEDEQVVLGVGVAGHLPCDDFLELAEFHPTAQPGFQLAVAVRDGVVTAADPRIGLMHRSAEKLFEVRDYRQIMMLANRHDWLSAITSELGVALAVEAATGISPPERATWIRTLLAEANHVSAALAFLAPVAPDPRQRVSLFQAREQMVALQERITGARMHPSFLRIGGVAAPLDGAQLDDVAAVLASLGNLGAQCAQAIESLAPSVSGVAVLDRDAAIAMGASGAVARASGLDIDLRRDEPYLAYADLAGIVHVPVAVDADAAARYAVIAAQVGVSLTLISACVDRLRGLGDGPIDVLLPKVVRVPEGVTQSWVEGPLGISGYLLASTGEKTPWRLKIRSASFNNMQAMRAALVGTRIDKLADAVMSFLLVIGDTDR